MSQLEKRKRGWFTSHVMTDEPDLESKVMTMHCPWGAGFAECAYWMVPPGYRITAYRRGTDGGRWVLERKDDQ